MPARSILDPGFGPLIVSGAAALEELRAVTSLVTPQTGDVSVPVDSTGVGTGTYLAESVFEPGDLSGLVLWLRADLGITYVQGPVVATGTTPPAVTFTGTPSSPSNSIVLTCTAAGTQTTATFSWTLNGIAQAGFTAAATVVLAGTGITANFPVGAYTNSPTADTYTSVVTVSAWADQSGLGNNFVQATAANQPSLIVNGGPTGGPCLLFDGVTQRMSIAATILPASPFTLFQVRRALTTSTTTLSVLFGTLGTNGIGFQVTTSNRVVFYAGQGSLVDSSATTSWEGWCAQNSGSTTTLLINGASQSLTNSSMQPIAPTLVTFLGTGAPLASQFNGDIVETIAYNTLLSANSVAAVRGYLTTRYGVG